ncbi:MAG: hypothetical protein ABII76_17755 [Pseudomonadota bacterium]
MESLNETRVRKRPAVVATRRQRLIRRRLLALVSDEVAKLRAAGHSPSAIARTLGISARDARAFCSKPPTPASMAVEPAPPIPVNINHLPEVDRYWERLPDRAVRALIRGRHAAVGGSTDEARVHGLSRIVAAYTMAELLEEPGIGFATAMRIELWLERVGLGLRATTAPPRLDGEEQLIKMNGYHL